MQTAMSTQTHPSCWIITEGLAGTENQCLGVAEALGLKAVIKRIALRQPWASLSPYLGFECAETFIPTLAAPWPDLVIASGRKSIAASRYIKRMNGSKTFTVQIQDPRISPRYFDLVAVPLHDPTRGPNVITTTAAPNRIHANTLTEEKNKDQRFAHLKSPRVAVLVGGKSRAYSFTEQTMHALADQLRDLDAGLMITTSRRTGSQNESILKNALRTRDDFFWDGQAPNPYFSMLAWADIILVTADSTSMLSEAATTGKPTYVIPLEGGTKRLMAMQKNLIATGALRVFDGNLEFWNYTPLNDAEKIATEIRKRMGL
jgi:mitochondrial fission protein ELM1